MTFSARPATSSRTPTGTASGTNPSSASGCAWWTCSTRCSNGPRPTPTSGSPWTGRWPPSRTTWRSVRRRRGRALVEAGQLAIGPWQILSDEFLVSGETLVRNLERGLATAARLGGAMRVGYLPDEFGHAAQMPQILRRAGFEHAVVWRGVPSAVAHHAFLWSAPDGSTVRAEYL